MPVREHRASDYLRTPEDVAAYLNAAVDEMEGDPRLLMKAFRNVAEAQGGVSALAREAGWIGWRCRGRCPARERRGSTRSRRSPPRVGSSCSSRLSAVKAPGPPQTAIRTIVTPSPPSRRSAPSNDVTSGCSRSNSRTATRSRPVPLPCTSSSRCSPAR